MDDATTQILSVAGAFFGFVGMVTGVASVLYTRRQAIAAEGPLHPSAEVNHHTWDEENLDWYRLDIIVRNRTNEAWELMVAKTPFPFRSSIFSTYSRPYEGETYDPRPVPLNEVPASKLHDSVDLSLSIGPSGAKHFHGHGGDTLHVSLFLKPSSFSRLTNRLWVSLSLEAKTERVRHKDIAVTRRLKPRIIKPA